MRFLIICIYIISTYARENVFIPEGDYYLNQTFKLENNTNYLPCPENNYPVVFIGGKKLPFENFKRTNISVYQISLFDLGIDDEVIGDLNNPYPTNKLELFYNNEPMILARYPNKNWIGYNNISIIDNYSFNITMANNILSLTNNSDIWTHGYWKYDWRDTYIKIKHIEHLFDTKYKITRYHDTPSQYNWTDGSRFYFVNSLVFLDSPKEYFVDIKTGILYFYPPNKLNINDSIIVSTLSSIVNTTNIHNVSINNITFTISQRETLLLTNANNVNITNSIITNSGNDCINIEGSNIFITNNYIVNCGAKGIMATGGNFNTLSNSNISIIKNNITKFSRIIRASQPAIGFNSVGMYVANNTLTDGPHTVIYGNGNNNLFEFNTISNSNYECSDCGAFYIERSWSQRGNVARYNNFSNIYATEKLGLSTSRLQSAFYLDDQMSGWDFYNNIISNSNLGVLLGGGRRNNIHNNYFFNNSYDIFFDNRGMTKEQFLCSKPCVKLPCFYYELLVLNYTNPPYSTEYPELVDIYDYYPCVPIGNIIEDNTWCHINKGQFIDQTPETIDNWFSYISNNKNIC